MPTLHFTIRSVRRTSRFPGIALAFLAASMAFACGCSMSQTKVTTPGGAPLHLETATKSDLIARYDSQAGAIRSVNAGITLTLTAGSAYSGVIKQYHEVSGFLLAARPSRIRVIGQLPVVGTNVFDMESDGETFRIFIPPQSKFITGPATLERSSDKPIENLRPQHLLDAIFWPAIPQGAPVLFEEASDSSAEYYVLTLTNLAAPPAVSGESGAASPDWRITRKIWFDRSDLHISRLTTYDTEGKIASDVRYSHWDTAGPVKYAHDILLARPANDYTLEIGITKVTFNEDINDDRFVVKQPPGVQVIHLGDDSPDQSNAQSNGQPHGPSDAKPGPQN
jgi:hypothetical protein